MSDTVIIALIIAAVILIALVIFRKQLSKLFVKISKDSVEAGLETREPGSAAPAATDAAHWAASKRPGVVVSGNRQIGTDNVIEVSRDDAAVKDNLQDGRDQKLKVRPDKSSDTPKP